MRRREIRLVVPGRIRTGMDIRGIRTQAELARKAGISHCTLSAILNLKHTPNRGTLQKIADALHVKAEWLLGNRSLSDLNAPTLCWTCQRAVPGDKTSGCSWSRKLEPVKGWDAYKSMKRSNAGRMDTYHVLDCPEYLPDEEE